MKGILHKTEQGWIVIYDEIIGENIVKKNQNALPLCQQDQNPYEGLIDDSQNEGLEVDFEIVDEIIDLGRHGSTTVEKAKILTPEEAELKDWDVTLNDGLEKEPYISDDFQIGPDGAYEHTQGLSILKEEAKDELIKVLYSQVMDLTMMSKIELGDDVIAEIKRLNNILGLV
jgi:hypothetical protein